VAHKISKAFMGVHRNRDSILLLQKRHARFIARSEFGDRHWSFAAG
jgi:hypothetical protein